MRADRDALRRTGWGREFLEQSRKVECRSGAAQRGALPVIKVEFDVRWCDHYGSPAASELRSERAVADEDQFVGFSHPERGKARNLERLVAVGRTAQKRCQLCNSNRPRRSRHELASE